MVKKITGFLAIPKENAKKGEIISGVILFSLEQMKIKVTNLNGGSDSYRIVKVIFEESDCKECKNGFLIPRTKEVRVEKTFSVQNFLQL
ncbi:hypothetical protein EOM09_08115 [bacterium]|nr:hypothetical protein [bacterium]